MNSPDELLSKLDHARKSLENGPLRRIVAEAANQDTITLVNHKSVAAITLAVRGGFREAWSRREEMSTALYEKYEAKAPQRAGMQVPSNFRELDRDQPIERITCTNCQIKPGFGPCPRCSGVGVLLVERPGSESTSVEDCPFCEDGFAPCTVCGGSRQTVRASIRYVNIKPFDTNHIVGDGVGESIRSALSLAYPGTTQPPKAFSYGLDQGHSAYRGKIAGAEHFHGYAFGDGLKIARAFVHRVNSAPNLMLYELKTFALPYVLAALAGQTGEIRVALFIDGENNARFSLL